MDVKLVLTEGFALKTKNNSKRYAERLNGWPKRKSIVASVILICSAIIMWRIKVKIIVALRLHERSNDAE